MIISSIDEFLAYYEKIRGRTHRVIRAIPPQQIEWTYKEGKFTMGDIIRHLATIERHMYAESAQFQPSRYSGCGVDLADGYDNILNFFDRLHEESMTIFSKLTPEDLQKKCTTPGGTSITLWKWLRAMVEHEIHHRGQLYMYLGMLGVETPPLYGLTAEQVEERSVKADQ